MIIDNEVIIDNDDDYGIVMMMMLCHGYDDDVRV